MSSVMGSLASLGYAYALRSICVNEENLPFHQLVAHRFDDVVRVHPIVFKWQLLLSLVLILTIT